MSVLDLLAAHDIVKPDQDAAVVKKYLNTLESFGTFESCSLKDVQEFVSSVNVCLNSSRGRINGLLSLKCLVNNCSADFFAADVSSFFNVLFHQILAKPGSLNRQEAGLSCSILQPIFRHGPGFPDVSKQLSSVVPTILGALLEIGRVHGAKVVLDALVVVLNAYPGSSGGQGSKIEAFLLRSSTSEGNIDKLATCYAAMTRLGGSGKDGINHKEAWKERFQKCIEALNQLYFDLKSILPGFSSAEGDREKRFDWSVPTPKDPLKRAFVISQRFKVVARLLSSLIRMKFHYEKVLKPGRIVEVAQNVFSLKVRDLAEKTSHESKILIAVLPEIYYSTVALIGDTLQSIGLDMMPYFEPLTKLLCGALNDLERSPKVRAIVHKVFGLMVDEFGACLAFNSRIKEVIKLTIADFTIPQERLEFSAKRQPNKRKNSLHKLIRQERPSYAATAALTTLSKILGVAGPHLAPVLHKSAQCVVVSTCFDVQKALKTDPDRIPAPFSDPETRKALYCALMGLLKGMHPKWAPPLDLAQLIFADGAVYDPDPAARNSCASKLSHCRAISQPSRPPLGIPDRMSPEEIEKTMNEMMKVHTVFLHSSVEAGLKEARPSAPEPQAIEEEEKEESKPKEEPIKESKGYQMLAFAQKETVVDKEPEVETEPEVNYEESRLIMKSYYSFDNEAIVIPENVKNSRPNRPKSPETKKRKIEEENENDEEVVDINEMLGSFVDNLNESG